MHALSREKSTIFIGRIEFTRSGEVEYVDGNRFCSGNYRKSIFLFARIRILFIGRVHLTATSATNDEEERIIIHPVKARVQLLSHHISTFRASTGKHSRTARVGGRLIKVTKIQFS